MITYDIRKIFPRFLLNDTEGYAMCRAVAAGIDAYLAVCQAALDTWGNVDEMPEWRLDELAWEWDCPYDAFADVEHKRKWIRDAYLLARTNGTPGGIVKYLEGFFDAAEVQDNENDLDPYHFRVVVATPHTEAYASWIQKAVAMVKNVRSVLDNIEYHGDTSEVTEYLTATSYGVEINVESEMLY